MKILGREPTLWLSTISALVVIVGTFGLGFINGNQAALIVAVINAIFGAVNAYAVRPISPVAFTYAVAAIAALLAGYGFNLPPETLAAVNTAIVPILALLSRGQVSPTNNALSRATTPDEKAVAEPGTGAAPSATITG